MVAGLRAAVATGPFDVTDVAGGDATRFHVDPMTPFTETLVGPVEANKEFTVTVKGGVARFFAGSGGTERTLEAVASLVEMGDSIRDLLHEQVPVSATFVMSERLRRRSADV